jgi:hypothetical protein
VGYAETQKRFRLYEPVSRKVKISRDLIFHKHVQYLSNNTARSRNIIDIISNRALWDLFFCRFIWQFSKNFIFLSAISMGRSTLTKKVRGEQVHCFNKLHLGAEGGINAELLIRAFSPQFAVVPDKTAKKNRSRKAL